MQLRQCPRPRVLLDSGQAEALDLGNFGQGEAPGDVLEGFGLGFDVVFLGLVFCEDDQAGPVDDGPAGVDSLIEGDVFFALEDAEFHVVPVLKFHIVLIAASLVAQEVRDAKAAIAMVAEVVMEVSDHLVFLLGDKVAGLFDIGLALAGGFFRDLADSGDVPVVGDPVFPKDGVGGQEVAGEPVGLDFQDLVFSGRQAGAAQGGGFVFC